MRPGTKVRFFSPGYKNKPSVDPPALLRLVAALSFISVIGVLVYSVMLGTTGIGFSEIEAESAMYIAILHCVLPLAIFYTITTNSRLSRPLLTSYLLVLYSATLAGKGYLGTLDYPLIVKSTLLTAALLIMLLWLYRNAQMRCYYALISDKPIPRDLEERAGELVGRKWLTPNGRARVEWLLDNLETVVLLGFIVAAIIAVKTTSD